MLLFLIAYMGGVLTILSPCILPVLPFVFARADRSFARGTLPLLLGMTITFAAVGSLAAAGGNWAVNANEFGRDAAIALMLLFGVALLWPALSEWAARPFVALGGRLSNAAGDRDNPLSSFVLGIATGLLWTPCAGPILGLVLTGAALQCPNVTTSFLLLAYAAGAATSLALALFAGGRIFAALKTSLGADVWVRRGLGLLVIAAVLAIALGLDTGYLTQLSLASTTRLEQSLIDRIQPNAGTESSLTEDTATPANNDALQIEGELPPLNGAVTWINTPPLSPEALRDKIVLVDFWTYSCINCLRALPYIRAWAEKYKDYGLVVLGVHTPEFAFEKDVRNVTRATRDLKINYPVAVDSNYAIWQGFNNHYWPAHYFIDGSGHIRSHHFGEGQYRESEEIIQALLIEAGYSHVPNGYVNPDGTGIEAAPSMKDVRSPETYIGFLRARNFASPGSFGSEEGKTYSLPKTLDINEWALAGNWSVGKEMAGLNRASGKIAFRFHARDLHLVLGPATVGKAVRYRVKIDGMAPKADHGADTDANGIGTVTEQRLYQLIRLAGPVEDHTFEIEFLDPGVQAYSFTFG